MKLQFAADTPLAALSAGLAASGLALTGRMDANRAFRVIALQHNIVDNEGRSLQSRICCQPTSAGPHPTRG